MFIQSGPMGVHGLYLDPPAHAIPVGAWSNCMNVRFNDGYCERIREPMLRLASVDDALWVQQYVDTEGNVRVVYGSATELYQLSLDGSTWDNVTNATRGSYNATYWQSFPWGNSVVFNNGVEPPQILFPGAGSFVDLPNFGVINDYTDPDNPVPVDLQATCAVIRPFLNYLVAIDITVIGTPPLPLDPGRNPNALWHSAPLTSPPNDAPSMPGWDYANANRESQVNIIGIEDGPLVECLALNNRMMLYTASTTHSMVLTGSSAFPFAYDRVLEYGLISVNAVTQFNNLHFCVANSTLYVHDGATVNQLADGKVQETFINSLTAADEGDLPRVQVVENQDTKEIHVLYDTNQTGGASARRYLIYNYKDNNFSQGQAYVTGAEGIEPCNCFSYGFANNEVVTWAQLQSEGTTWDDLRQGGVAWAQLQRAGLRAEMFWMTTGGLYEAERREIADRNKQYFLERYGIDLSEQNPQATSNRWKHLRQIYPHIDTQNIPQDVGADWGDLQITVGWTQTLLSREVRNPDTVRYDTLQQDYKVDVRTTGRYLYAKIEALTDGFFRLTSMDYDVTLQQRR